MIQHVETHGEALFRVIAEHDQEGIVAMRIGAPYPRRATADVGQDQEPRLFTPWRARAAGFATASDVMPRLPLYPFRYRSEVTGKWVKARYIAEMHEIEREHAPGDWEIIGPPEVRDVDPDAAYFSPWRAVPDKAPVKEPPRPKKPPEKDPPSKEPPVKEPTDIANALIEQPPAMDAIERFLVALFLRRYVTYCARRRRFAQMQGAARLLRQVASTAH
ncbi:MAG TPA: hypothetical protein VKV24_10730 [Casimicrobiaceae bacterium]|nr:hypothetical protein [Casimicrobiaceae bacterium]